MNGADDLLQPYPLSTGIAATVKSIVGKQLTAQQLTTDCLRRIGEQDDVIASMVHLDPESALLRAAEIDANAAPELPLAGIPIIVKEIFSVNGMPDSSGSRMATPELFAGEGSFVQKLKELGCIVLGKSLSTEFALAHFNSTKRMPVNPAITGGVYATGGSSSGSAAAVAAGFCGFAIGTDTGGSVRAPAAMCGITGFKPTAGRWPMDGVFPLSAQLDSPGLFTRSVRDARYIMAALGEPGEDSSDCSTVRLGVPTSFFCTDLDPEVAAAFAVAKQKLLAAGVELLNIELPPMDAVENYFAHDLPHELLTTLGDERVAENLDALDPLSRKRLQAVVARPEAAAYGGELDALAVAAEAAIRGVGLDGWICPTVPCIPLQHGELANLDVQARWQSRVSRNTRCINAMRMTAISLPLPGKWPVGLQIAALGHADSRLLNVAEALEPIVCD